jgi:HEAT repeat protein
MNRLEKLKKMSQAGRIAEEDVDRIAVELQDPKTSSEDRTDMLRIIAWSSANRHRNLVESLLDDQDLFVARLALSVLSEWDDKGEYAHHILRFMLKPEVEAEESGSSYLRDSAITSAGEWLRRHNNISLLNELLSIFEDETEDPDVRGWAYCALARSTGRDWSQVPSAGEDIDLGKDIDVRVLQQVQKRIQDSSTSGNN